MRASVSVLRPKAAHGSMRRKNGDIAAVAERALRVRTRLSAGGEAEGVRRLRHALGGDVGRAFFERQHVPRSHGVDAARARREHASAGGAAARGEEGDGAGAAEAAAVRGVEAGAVHEHELRAPPRQAGANDALSRTGRLMYVTRGRRPRAIRARAMRDEQSGARACVQGGGGRFARGGGSRKGQGARGR